MSKYQVNVTRGDRWWMIEVPELEGHVGAGGAVNVGTHTQARRLADVPNEARDFICTVTDTAPSEVAMDITISVDDIDVTGRADQVAADRAAAERHATQAQTEARELARQLAAHHIAVRDIGEVLGVSFQRAQQLIST